MFVTYNELPRHKATAAESLGCRIFMLSGTSTGDAARFAMDLRCCCDQLFCIGAVHCGYGGEDVPVYLDVLMLLNFLVDLFLLLGTQRLSGYAPDIKRAVLAAALGGVYGGVCILPSFQFLANTVWRVVILGLMAVIAFGCRRDSLRRGILFVLLSMSLGGVAAGLSGGSFWTLTLSALAVCTMCLLGFRGRVGREYLPVVLEGLRLTALRDTGNTLTDPVTGQQVLVVSAEVGKRLLGLSQGELSNPVDVLSKVSGGRLIPYHAVGKSAMLLTKRYENVSIGTWKGSCLVAFAPNRIGEGKPYDALTGGVF